MVARFRSGSSRACREVALTRERKQDFHERFAAVVAGRGSAERFKADLEPLLSSQTLDAERVLIHEIPGVVHVTFSLSDRQRAAIERCVRVICEGMAEFQRNARLSGLADVHELERYCYYVAGGCLLVETAVLERIGGFGAIRDALIDDCALARGVKDAGGRTWIGLTHSALSLRRTRTLGAIWNMVARSAFAQLRFSTFLLLCCVALLVLAFWIPLLGLLARDAWTRWTSLAALAAMVAGYIPMLRYYARSPPWVLALPLTGTLYLFMTVDSAVRAWRGVRSEGNGRLYRAAAT